jgi:hypothetical protein
VPFLLRIKKQVFQLKRLRLIRHAESCNRSTDSSEATSPKDVIQCFLFEFPAPSPFLKVSLCLLTSSASSSCHFLLISSFNYLFQKAPPIQDVTNPFFCIVWRIFLLSMTLHNTSFIARSVQLSSLSFSSITFQHVPCISDLLSEMSKISAPHTAML